MRRRWKAALAAAVVPVAALAVAGTGGAAPTNPGGTNTWQGSAAGDAPGRTITLVTGDRVRVAAGTTDPNGVSVAPGVGRENVGISRYVRAGHLYVVPLDAAPLISAGRLDRRLFDVTALLAFGYDDAGRADLPLIVSYRDGQAPAARTKVARPVERELPSIDAFTVAQPKARATAFWAAVTGGPVASGRSLTPAVEHVWLDGRAKATLDRSVPQIGAPAAWQAGLTGRDTTVAVLDTGIDANHPDLADAVAGGKDFTDNPNGVVDGNGHGTHVASTITGSGAASGGRYVGVAPDTKLLVGKVLEDSGFGADSGIIAGMEWAVGAKADVVSMSLGSAFADDGTDPMSVAVNELSARSDTLFVIASGNQGPGGNVAAPGAADAALTVGAVDGRDELAPFSSGGPRAGDDAIKPDITAPGVDIAAARAAGTELGEPVDDSYTRLSGTSMATPHVAGAAAILAGQHPDWTGEQLKEALMGSAAPAADVSVFDQGAGRVDVARAVSQQVSATPGSLSLGIVQWPHTDDPVTPRTVGYRNTGDSAVTLAVSTDITGPGGVAAPAGLVSTDASTVTVPAHGAAKVTVTVDTRLEVTPGRWSGAVVARSADGTTSVRTPLAVTVEPESYTVTLNVIDRAGAPTWQYGIELDGLDQPVAVAPWAESGPATVRVPKGRYTLWGTVGTPDPQTPRGLQTMIAEPQVNITADRTITIDAREGTPVGSRVDKPAAGYGAVLTMAVDTAAGPITWIYVTGPLDDIWTARPSTTTNPGHFTFTVQDDRARPDGRGGFTDSPYVYHPTWTERGSIGRTTMRTVHDRDLVAVRTPVAHAGSTNARPDLVDQSVALSTRPAAYTAYYSPGQPHYGEIYFGLDDTTAPDGYLFGRRTFRRGAGQTERWNAAVFAPGLPDRPGYVWAGRSGDRMDFWLPMYGDQAGHGGFSRTDTQSTWLYRDGVRLGGSDDPRSSPAVGRLTVPAEDGTYRLETTAARSVSTFTTSISATWTFRSGHVDESRLHPLPFLAVRFAPNVDERNAVPAGRFSFPLRVERNPGATGYGTVNTVTVDASFDDGKSWRKATVTGSGAARTVTVDAPAGTSYVSLRTAAADSAGNAVTETIVHAYAVR